MAGVPKAGNRSLPVAVLRSARRPMGRAGQHQCGDKYREYHLAGGLASRGSRAVVEQGLASAHEREVPDLFFITFGIAGSKDRVWEDAQGVSCTGGQVRPHP